MIDKRIKSSAVFAIVAVKLRYWCKVRKEYAGFEVKIYGTASYGTWPRCLKIDALVVEFECQDMRKGQGRANPLRSTTSSHTLNDRCIHSADESGWSNLKRIFSESEYKQIIKHFCDLNSSVSRGEVSTLLCSSIYKDDRVLMMTSTDPAPLLFLYVYLFLRTQFKIKHKQPSAWTSCRL